MQAIQVQRQIGGRTLSIETGTYAKLAGGSVSVQYGDSVVFGAVVRAKPRGRLAARCAGLRAALGSWIEVP